MKQYGKLDLRNCDCMDLMAEIPDSSQHLIIVDPPYFEIKGNFDFIWSDFEQYLADVETWAIECKRVLSGNGTLIWWGHAKKIAYSQVILDRYLTLENSLVWKKTECQTLKNKVKDLRSFAPVTERALMYSNERIGGGKCKDAHNKYLFEIGMARTELMRPIVDYMIGEMKSAGFTVGEINKSLNTKMAGHWFTDKSQWALPTEEWYNKLQKLFNHEYLKRDYDDLKRDYDDLKRDYDDLRRYFNLDVMYSDVLEFSQESHITSKYNHPTQKPPTLTRLLVTTCSRPGNNCLIPFMGSGTEVVEAWRHGLNVTGSELDPDYYKAMIERIDKETAQQELF